jgi:hypothetical protein
VVTVDHDRAARHRSKITTTDSDEERAQQVLQRVLEVRVDRTDRGGKDGDGRTDLGFTLPDGPGVAEVISTRNEQSAACDKAVEKKSYVPVDRMKRLWCVYLESSMNVKSLHKTLPRHLKRLEDLGVSQVISCDQRQHLPSDLQTIPDCLAFPPDDSTGGYFFLQISTSGFSFDAEQTLQYCEQFLHSRPDKAKKLRREGARAVHRHLVLLIDLWSQESKKAFHFLQAEEVPIPPRPPALQEGVTGLWIIPLTHLPPACPILYWSAVRETWTSTQVPL